MSENWKMAALAVVMVLLAASFFIGNPMWWAWSIFAVAVGTVGLDTAIRKRRREDAA